MGIEILTEIVLHIFDELHLIFKTKLPFQWDFVRLNIESTTRLLINSGSYFFVYILFLLWFVKQVLKLLKTFSQNGISTKDWYFIVLLSFATAAEILWPLFLTYTYFLTCSYYPWFSVLIVLILHIPIAPWTLFSLLISSATDFFEQSLSSVSISLDGIVSAKNSISEYLSSQESFLTAYPDYDEAMSEDNLPTAMTDTASIETMKLDSESMHNLGRHSVDFRGIIHERANSMYHTDISETSLEKNGEPVNIYKETIEAKFEKFGNGVTFLTSGDKMRNASFPEQKERIRSRGRGSTTNVQNNKKGFCGRCWRVNGLPFRRGFSGLRELYRTRSGHAYGAIAHLLKTDEYVKQYGV